MKRSVIFALLLCLLLQLTPAASAAVISDTEGARAAILQAYEDAAVMDGGPINVDLEQYCLTVPQLDEIMYELKYLGQQPWYIGTYRYSYLENSEQVQILTLTRLNSQTYNYDLYEQTVQQILHSTLYEGMSDWQIALALHDYLVANCAYDETLTLYSSYDALVLGSAVCSGYAEAYMELLQRAGVECRYVSSEEMNHGWNLVKLGENWYHVDTTWDDPTPNDQGQVMHTYFLVSDSAMQSGEDPHYGWRTEDPCTDTSLDTDCFWQGVDSAICFESADICYYRRQTGDTGYTVYRRDGEGSETEFYTTDAGYIDIGGSSIYTYFYPNNGLSLVGDTLYYSDMVGVYAVSTGSGEAQCVYSHDYAAERTYIRGSQVSGNALYLTLSSHSGDPSERSLELPGAEDAHVHQYTEETAASTCAQLGYTTFTCECGMHYRGALQPKTEHSFDGGVILTQPTAIVMGTKCYTCTVCGYEKTERIPTVSESDKTEADQDDPAISEELMRRIGVGAGVIVLSLIFRRKRKK